MLRATAAGYGTLRRPVSVTAAAPNLVLGPLPLRAASTRLTDVVVTGTPPVVSGGLDKKEVDVTKDLTATGGTTGIKLKNVPSATIN